MELYPVIEPYRTEYFSVSPIHSLYVEEVGNPNGKPILFLHGGPGGGMSEESRRFFDPAFYRVIRFDQRGAGKSTPMADLTDNTTWDLVEDIERLRVHLGIEKWVVFGGSWGSTLSIAYAEKYPEAVIGLILRGIFLDRKEEVRWLYQEGASWIFPDAWEKFIAPIPESERKDMVSAYYRQLTSEDEKVRLEAARAWSQWEASIIRLIPEEQYVQKYEAPENALPIARIECHYFTHDGFLPNDSYLLDHIDAIRQLPCRIVQGRYDIVCPPHTAWELARALPDAELRIVPDAGHSAMETGIASELVTATEDFKRLYI